MRQEAYRLKVIKLASGEIEIIGNRAALNDLGDVCHGLGELSDEVGSASNHYHIADYMNNAEEGSLEVIIRCDPDL